MKVFREPAGGVLKQLEKQLRAAGQWEWYLEALAKEGLPENSWRAPAGKRFGLDEVLEAGYLVS